MARRELKAIIKCRGCHRPLPLEDRLLDWVTGSGRKSEFQYLRRLPWCEPCHEKQVEKQEIKELEAWPDLEETLESGLELISEEDPPYSQFACPEGSLLMPGEETTW